MNIVPIYQKASSYKNFIFIFALTLFGFVNNIYAQSGHIDTTFEAALYNRFGTGMRAAGAVNASLLLSDGKIMIGGSFSTYNGTPCRSLVRLYPDGSLDTTFHFQNYFSSITSLSLLQEGKMLVAGEGTFGVVKINPDGDMDTAFRVSNMSGYVRDMVVQNDQKIIIGGRISAFGDILQHDILRLNSNGTIDSTFDIGVGINSSSQFIYTVALQPDGKILVGGSFTVYNNILTGGIIRLNNDGSRDVTFNPGMGANGKIFSIVVKPDNKIIATGDFTEFNSMSKNGIVCLLTDGSFDPGFSTGTGALNVYKVILKNNGDIVIGGYFGSYDMTSVGSVAVLNPDGTLQSSTDCVMGDGVLTLQVQPDNKILAGGLISTTIGGFQPGGIIRMLPNGSLDSSFVPWTGSSGLINDLELLSNGKTLIAGDFRSYDGYGINRIARLNEDGTLDPTFHPGTGANDAVKSMAIQSDGKIILGGLFTTINGIVRNKIARLNSDGTLDLSFSPGTSGEVSVVEIQPDGKILVCGHFYDFNGVTTVSGLVRLNQNGSLDPGFNLSPGAAFSLMALQSDGKIIVNNAHYNNVQLGANPTMRLNPNGTLDTTYNPDTYIPFVIKTIKLQSDNKILLGGYQFNSGKIIRLNSDGTRDSTFNSGTGSDYDIFDILPLSNGQMMVAGEFVHYNGRPASCLVRLNPNGSLDNTFHTQDYLVYNPAIKVVKARSDGQLLVAGTFDKYDGKPAHCIARIHHDIPETSVMQLTFDGISPVTCNDNGTITAVATHGVPPYSYTWETIPAVMQSNIQPESPGFYSVTVTDSMGQTRQQTILLPGYGSMGIDLSAYLAYGEFRPGFVSNLLIAPMNDGCTPVNAQMKLVLPDLLSFNSADPVPSSISGDTLIWELSQLVYTSTTNTISVSVTTSVTALIGDSILLTTLITPIAGDEVPENNLKTYELPIVNAFDPNYIAVYPAGKCTERFISKDQVLNYTIHFQNTGNSEAVNIHLLDTLDAALDIATVRVIAQSHEAWTELLPGNVLRFNFDNIHLADSTNNEPESHGYILFEVKPFSGSNQGVVIRNQAGIYFDFNPVVTTNNVSNTLFSGDLESYNCTLGIAEAEMTKVKVYPNPFVNGFTIYRETSGDAEITLTDLQGKMIVSSFKTSEKTIVLTGDQLQSGLYLLRIKTAEGERIVKIVKQ